MPLLVHRDLLITSDLRGLKAFDISDPAAPRLVASLDEPTEPNVFKPDSDGEQMSGVCAGLIARSFTPLRQDGHWAEQHSSIGVYDTALRPVARLPVGIRLDDRSLALSPDGLRIASVSRGEGVVILDARSGAVLARHAGEIGSGVSWSPDGRWIAAGDTGQADGELYLLDLQPEGEAVRVPLPSPSCEAPLYDSPFESAWSSDSALVAFSCAAWSMRGVAVYTAATAQERWSDSFNMTTEDEEDWRALRVAFAAGNNVVLVGIEGGLRAYRAADGEPLTLLACDGDGGIEFAADDLRRCIWRLVGGEPISSPYPADWAAR